MKSADWIYVDVKLIKSGRSNRSCAINRFSKCYYKIQDTSKMIDVLYLNQDIASVSQNC